MESFSKQLNRHQKQLATAIETLSGLERVCPDPLDSETLLQLDSVSLHYYACEKPRYKTPLLICYALINRPYILDLEPGRSLIRDLLEAGQSVYLIDWGYPKENDRHIGLDDYIGDYLHTAVEQVKLHSQQSQVDLLGVCQGGVFSLCYASLFPRNVQKLITLVTPIDTSVENFTLARMVSGVDIDALVACGNISGAVLNQFYASLKPLELGLHKQLRMTEQFGSKSAARTFLRMEYWLNDSPDLTARSAAEFAIRFFRDNGLVNGTLNVCGQLIDLGQLTQPVLNAFGIKDHLVPPASSAALATCLKRCSQYTALELNAGHIGAFASSTARRKLVKAVSTFRRG